MHNTNATADASPCNGIFAILDQQKACVQIAMILNGRGLSPPPPFGLRSLYTHTPYHLTWHTAPMMNRSHKLATMPSYFGWPFAFLPMDTFIIHGGPSQIRLCRKGNYGLESSPIRRQLALSAILATDGRRERNASAVMYATSITISGSKNANI